MMDGGGGVERGMDRDGRREGGEGSERRGRRGEGVREGREGGG